MSQERAVDILISRMERLYGSRAPAECLATAFWSERQGFADVARLWQAAAEGMTGRPDPTVATPSAACPTTACPTAA